MEDAWRGTLPISENSINKFEDSFVYHQHLPDSKQYLENLENRLAKLKSKDCKGKELLSALSKTRQSHLERIVDSNSADLLNDPDLDQPVSPSIVYRFIAPERQANKISELYELLKYDQLGQLFENLEKEK